MSIGERLDKFAVEKYGNDYGYKSKFSKDLGIAKQTLSRYITNSLTPGNSLQNKLRELGCDVEWLMTGKRKVVVDGREIEVIDSDVVAQEAEKTEEIEHLQALKAKLEEENRQSDLKKEELKKKIEILEQENKELMKKLLAFYELKYNPLGNETQNSSETLSSTLKKISVEA